VSTVSSISPALDQLADLARRDAGLARDPAFPESSLFARLSQVPDRRKRRGRRHELVVVVVLVLAACATLVVGNDSVSAIWQWSAGTSQEVLARMGARRDPLRGRYLVPSERTFPRVLAGLDSDALDAATCGYAVEVIRGAAPVPVVARTPGPSNERNAGPGSARASIPSRPGCCPARPSTARPGAGLRPPPAPVPSSSA
jgi:DDE family transposase